MNRTSELLDRVPPSDDIAEQQLIGGMLCTPWQEDDIDHRLPPLTAPWDAPALDLLRTECFRDFRLRLIWAAMQDLYHDGEPIDLEAVGERLHAAGLLGDGPGYVNARYLIDLLWRGRPGYGAGLAARVASAAARRECVDVGLETVQAAYRDGDAGRLRECGGRLLELAAAVEAGRLPQRALRVREGETVTRSRPGRRRRP